MLGISTVWAKFGSELMNTQCAPEETSQSAEPMGTKLRRQRRRLGLTLGELAARAKISKPYLSLIETGRVPNPPSDEKLRRLEQTLGFSSGELLTQAHLQRTPRDVRAMLGKLLADNGNGRSAPVLLDAKAIDSRSLVGAA